MQTRTSLASGDLWCKGDVVAQLIAKVADDPLCQHQLIGSLLNRYRQELDFILLVVLAVE